jgi:hypothetical protein
MKKLKVTFMLASALLFFGSGQLMEANAQSDPTHYRVYKENPLLCTYGCYEAGGNCYSEEPVEDQYACD